MKKPELLNLIYAALTKPHGLVVETPTPERLRDKLYPIIKEEGVGLRLQIPQKEGELWLIPKTGSSDTKSSFIPEITL